MTVTAAIASAALHASVNDVVLVLLLLLVQIIGLRLGHVLVHLLLCQLNPSLAMLAHRNVLLVRVLHLTVQVVSAV